MGVFGCGKVILFGEHAAVFGHPALAAALSIGVEVTDAVPDDLDISLHVSPWGTRTTPGDGTRMGESLARILAAVEGDCGPVRPTRISMTSNVPLGAGLGSSAALAVATARQLILLSTSPPTDPTDLILRAAAASEQVFHGNPSGVDHTTSTLGGVLDFQRHRTPAFLKINAPPLPLIIAQMAEGADTGQMVAGVAARREALPGPVDALLGLLGDLALRARAPLMAGDGPALGLLMDLAHGALAAIGVATEALDRGCHAARGAGAWGAKLTGAGGGGCIICVSPEDRRGAIRAALEAAGALEIITTDAGFDPNAPRGAQAEP